MVAQGEPLDELLTYMSAHQVRLVIEQLREIRRGSGYGCITLVIDGRACYIERTERIPCGRFPETKTPAD